jgi:hypothetical protein
MGTMNGHSGRSSVGRSGGAAYGHFERGSRKNEAMSKQARTPCLEAYWASGSWPVCVLAGMMYMMNELLSIIEMREGVFTWQPKPDLSLTSCPRRTLPLPNTTSAIAIPTHILHSWRLFDSPPSTWSTYQITSFAFAAHPTCSTYPRRTITVSRLLCQEAGLVIDRQTLVSIQLRYRVPSTSL